VKSLKRLGKKVRPFLSATHHTHSFPLPFMICNESSAAQSIANTVITSAIELKENTVIVVLGASGDLAKKKTFPALFGLVSSLCPFFINPH
jgi:hypothetical protein